MIINKTGKIIEGFYSTGLPVAPIYLLDGDQPVLFDAGFAFLGEIYVNDIRKILGNREPAFCLLTHSHFDHCGSVSFLKKSFPSLKIVSSENAKKIFKKPKAIKLIKSLNIAAEQDTKKINPDIKATLQFEAFEIDQTVQEGDIIEVSKDLTIKVIETPGHTRDCLSYYIPEKKILLSSEAAGIADETGYIYSEFLIDTDMYIKSIKKLASLDIELLCPGHHAVFTEKDAKNFIPDSMSYCEKFIELVKKYLIEEQGDMEKVKTKIRRNEYDCKEGPKQPEPAYLLNLEAKIKAVKKQISESTS